MSSNNGTYFSPLRAVTIYAQILEIQLLNSAESFVYVGKVR